MRLPPHLIAVCAEIISDAETHATLDNLFMYAGAPGHPPDGNKLVKVQAWLRRVSDTPSVDSLEVLGLLIKKYMEPPEEEHMPWLSDSVNDRNQKRLFALEAGLRKASLQYFPGGKVCAITGSPTKSLKQHIEQRDFVAISQEFDRAVSSVESNPREAVSAASNILESVFKTYIEVNALEMPKKMDIKPLWKAVRDDLGLDPAKLEDRDLKEILSGLASITNGIGSLRSHASSAHGASDRSYRLEPRHARLAIHSAHTLALFVLETWDVRKRGRD